MSSKVLRDSKLEKAALARSEKLGRVLQPEARAKLDVAARALLARLDADPANADAYSLAQYEVSSRFPALPSEQSNLLIFYVLAQVLRIRASALRELLGMGRLDGMNEMSEMESLRLQMMMDRKSKLVSVLDMLMKKIAATQDAVVQNLK
jgi:hypothetical protein